MIRSIVLTAALVATGAAHAAGELDRGFDDDGIRVLDLGPPSGSFDRFTAGLIDHQGRLVGAGNTIGQGAGMVLARTLPDGRLDTGFGSGGVVRLPREDGSIAMRVEALVERPDGRLVLGATALHANASVVYTCQLLANGQLDPQWQNGGCTVVYVAPNATRDVLRDMVLQPDGRLVLLGTTDAGQPNQYFVARRDADGTSDGCFGFPGCAGLGVLINPEPLADLGGQFEPRGLALAPDGRIVLAGGAGENGSLAMAAIRLLPTGDVDAGFGNGGHRKVSFDLGGDDYERADAVAVNALGQVMLVGQVRHGFGTYGGAALLSSFGVPVDAWGDAGKRVLFFDDVSEQHLPTAARIQPDGSVIIGGYTADALHPALNCGVARLDPTGEPDDRFASAGYRVYDAHGFEDELSGDVCADMDTRFDAVALFGDAGPDGNDRDSLFLRIAKDRVLRDGFED